MFEVDFENPNFVSEGSHKKYDLLLENRQPPSSFAMSYQIMSEVSWVNGQLSIVRRREKLNKIEAAWFVE